MARRRDTDLEACTPRDSVDALLSSWAARRPDLDFSPVAIVSRLGRIRTHMDAEIDAVFAAHALTAPGFAVLVTLARVDDGGGVTQRRLMDELGLTSGTVSVRMDRLVADGLVDRRPDPASARNTLISLTERGRELFERVAPAHLANERRLLAALGDEELDTLANLLRKLLVEFEGSQPPAGRRAGLGLTLAPAHVAVALREAVGLEPVSGLLVRAVAETGPAKDAGLRTGDVLVRAGDRTLHAISDLYAAVAGAERVPLRFVRGSEARRASIALEPAVELDGALAASAGRGGVREHRL
jgi:DNA-binding MarR family transcriptional regulator